MRRTRTPIMLALAGLLASLVMFVSPGTAAAAELIPELRWSAVQIGGKEWTTVTSANGSVTEGCIDNTGGVGSTLRTYSATGSLVRNISASTTVDGVSNCIQTPAVDKNGDIYGAPTGGPNLLAYNGNTLKWKYPTGCSSTPAKSVVGADGNIYFINGSGRLIGVTPEIQPPLTQPAKVLDAPVSSASCGTELRAFKGGIAVVSDSWWVYFYTYTGVSLGYKNSNSSRAAVNAAGRLFYPTYTGSGDNRGIKISAYDSTVSQVVWTAQESSFGLGVDFFRTYPTPDGGAVVLIKRPKVVSGAPTSEMVYALVKLNSSGGKVWDKELSNQDASGNTYGNLYVVVDKNGKIVLVRDGSAQASNNSTTPTISITVLDADKNVVYDQVMSGNLNAASGSVNGYSVRYTGVNGLITGTDTLYLHAMCQGSCASYQETKLYPIKVTGLGLDYPRGAVISGKAGMPYVAMGDSFSSGEGVPPFLSGTDSGDNTCHRSQTAYSMIMSGNINSPRSVGAGSGAGFVACSGAETKHVKSIGFKTEPKQLDALNGNTKYVTISIGGNDIGFTPFGKACVLDTCAIGTSAYTTAKANIETGLLGNLKDTYRAILQTAPNAQVYVVNYPHVAPVKQSSDPHDSRCLFLSDSATGGQRWDDAKAARDIVTRLDGVILDAVNLIKGESSSFNNRLHLVDANGAGSPFIGHEMCSSGDSYFHNVNEAVNGLAFPFHPNSLGQEAYATLFEGQMG